MDYTGLLRIPEKYDTIEKKLEWLEEQSLSEQKRDRMEQDYSFQLYKTKEYWKMKKMEFNDSKWKIVKEMINN